MLAPQVTELIYSGTPSVASRAVKVLGDLGDKASLPALQAVVDNKAVASPVRDNAKASFEKLQPSAEERDWAKAAAVYSVIGGEAVKMPEVDSRYPSSRRITAAEARRTMTFAGTDQDYMARRYARSLPKLDYGEWGWIQFAEVAKVLGPKDVVIGDGEDQLRLVGFDTSSLADGQRWYGDLPPQKQGAVNDGLNVVIVGVTTVGNLRVKTAIPLAAAHRREMTLEQFRQLKASGKVGP
jgi:hypothetical protein